MLADDVALHAVEQIKPRVGHVALAELCGTQPQPVADDSESLAGGTRALVASGEAVLVASSGAEAQIVGLTPTTVGGRNSRIIMGLHLRSAEEQTPPVMAFGDSQPPASDEHVPAPDEQSVFPVPSWAMPAQAESDGRDNGESPWAFVESQTPDAFFDPELVKLFPKLFVVGLVDVGR